MPIEVKEDYSAPVSQKEIQELLNQTNRESDNKSTIFKILRLLNEKRDSYQGILQSILFVILSKDEQLIEILEKELIQLIISLPMSYGGKIFLNKVLFRLTLKQPSFVVNLFEKIIGETQNWSVNSDERGQVLNLQIISLKAIKKAEQIIGERSTALSDEQINSICDLVIEKCDDVTKIDTLSLIVNSKKSTKLVEVREIELYNMILHDAIRLQDPGLRQIFIALTNKLIGRMFASYRVSMREVKIISEKETLNLKDRYRYFLTYLINFCLDNIYCNVHFGSFMLTISTLKILTVHIKDFGDLFEIESILGSKRSYDSILCCLNDSFEQNKIIGLELILSLPHNQDFLSEKNIIFFENIAFQLTGSVNPAHSLSCQYLFKLIIGLKFKNSKATKTKNKIVLEQISKLISLVEESVDEVKINFLFALKSKPIYPKLTCIRALLDEIDIKQIEEDRENWTEIAQRIIDLSIEASNSVSTIVCNLNPETIGHLPMDLKPLDIKKLAETFNVSLNVSNTSVSTITSQMLLISGWKTIKECSLSLGAVCNLFWWPQKPLRKKKEKNPGFKSKPFIDNRDVIRIINFFDHYLRNLRHRGAFEQAYSGFIMVTKRIWYDDLFKELLLKNLQEIMNDFKSETTDDKKAQCLKAYVTRRSAGLPFIVRAILTSEHRNNSETLIWTMNCLFESIQDDNTDTYQKIHCLNILIALIKEHNLGEKVLPFVGKTLAITMKSFRADSFPIRNCANMLLKAVIDRTFGVNRIRDGIHRRNQLSFERFFEECPNLQSEMLQFLNDSLTDKRCFATLHSVYIVLFRLTSKIDFDYDKLVRPFLEPILKLVFQCPDYKLRVLSAKLSFKLESLQQDNSLLKEREEHHMNLIRTVVFKLESSKSLDKNQTHGALLLTKYWVDNNHSFSSFGADVVIQVLKQAHLSCTILDITMDLVEIWCQNNISKDKKWLLDLTDTLIDRISQKENLNEPHFENFVFKSITTMLMNSFDHNTQVTVIEFKNEKCHKIINLIKHIVFMKPNRSYSIELQASFIRLIRQILYNNCDNIVSLLNQLDIDSKASFMTQFDKLESMSENNMEKDQLNKYCTNVRLKVYIKQFIDLEKFFDLENYIEFNNYNNERYYVNSTNTSRGIELLALNYITWDQLTSYETTQLLPLMIDRLRFMVTFLEKLTDCDIKCVGLIFTGKLVQILVKSELNLQSEYESFCHTVKNLSESHNTLTIRISSAKVLQLCFLEIIQMRSKSRFWPQCLKNLIVSFVNLCQDEDYEIRSICHNILLKLKESIVIDQDGDYNDCNSQFSRDNWLNFVMKLIVLEIFNANNSEDIQHCVELISTFMINVNDCYYDAEQQEGEGEKESLFDKTRINDFADNCGLIQACVNALEMLFRRRQEQDPYINSKIELNSLKFPKKLFHELKFTSSIDLIEENSTSDGDYSIKHKSDFFNKQEDLADLLMTNEQYFENLLRSTSKNLIYFEDGYKNLLQDTSYSIHELWLYKHTALIRFITTCTRYDPIIDQLVLAVQAQFQAMVTKCCLTTMINKCIKFMNCKT